MEAQRPPDQDGPSDEKQQVVYVERGRNGFAVVALVCGLIGVALGLIPLFFFLAWTLGIVALVFGLLGRRRAKRDPHVGRKTMATWGAVLGVAALGLGVLGVAIINDAFEDVEQAVDELESSTNDGSRTEEKADEPEGKTVQLGEVLTFPRQWRMVIKDVDKSKTLTPIDDYGSAVKARGTFYILDLRVRNDTKESETFDDTLIDLVEDDGTVYAASGGKGSEQIANLANYLDERELQPKTWETGRLAFDVPRGVAITRARVSETLDIFTFDDTSYSNVEL